MGGTHSALALPNAPSQQEENRQPNPLQQRFTGLIARIGNPKNPDGEFEWVARQYSQPHRKYHTLEHIEHCLTEFDTVRDKITQPDGFELALWFHDLVYKPLSKGNEQASAELLQRKGNEWNIPPSTLAYGYNLILATEHHAPSQDPDTQYFCDIDLAILGAASLYSYGKQIREEYKWVPTLLYTPKRRQFLRRLLRCKHMFQTPIFRQRYEERAREKITFAIEFEYHDEGRLSLLAAITIYMFLTAGARAYYSPSLGTALVVVAAGFLLDILTPYGPLTLLSQGLYALWKKACSYLPDPLVTVESYTFKDEGIQRKSFGVPTETWRFADLTKILVVTTGMGPLEPDCFVVLFKGTHSIAIPTEKLPTNIDPLLQLPAFDLQTWTTAMTSTEYAEFLVWEKTPQPLPVGLAPEVGEAE